MFYCQILLAQFFLFQRIIAKHSPNVSVVHWGFYSALPSSYFAYQRKGCSHFDDLRAIYIIRWKDMCASSPD